MMMGIAQTRMAPTMIAAMIPDARPTAVLAHVLPAQLQAERAEYVLLASDTPAQATQAPALLLPLYTHSHAACVAQALQPELV